MRQLLKYLTIPSAVISIICLASIAFAQTAPPVDASAIQKNFNRERALADVRFLTDYWRIGGGPDFDIALDRVQSSLERTGFRVDPTAPLSLALIADSASRKVWVPLGGEIAILSPDRKVLHTYNDTPVMLVRNAPPTPPEGIAAPLLFLPPQAIRNPKALATVRGRIILSSAPPSAAVTATLRAAGALGIISSWTEAFNEPTNYPDAVREGPELPTPPEDNQPGFFAVKCSYNTDQYLTELALAGPVRVKVTTESLVRDGVLKTLVAEIRGTTHPDQRVVLIAHIDHYKPGANDNASGAATLLEIARAWAEAINDGTLQRPDRTVTFLWVDEYNGVPQWLTHNPGAAGGIVSAFVMDMVGADTTKTGGTFLLERAPDPGSLQTRPPDVHTAWGAHRPPQIFGTFLNDYFRGVLQWHAEATGWFVGENPYEGGSDHDPFLARKIPAILTWHFPDRFYHTSMDTFDKVSVEEMEHVGIAIATAALGLASPTPALFDYVRNIVKEKGLWRLRVEHDNAAKNLADAEDPKKTLQRELIIRDAWRDWYGEAIVSVRTVLPDTLTLERALQLESAIEEILAESRKPLQ